MIAQEAAVAVRTAPEPRSEPATRPKRLALVASKGTLDMVYPPLILAVTAASMGWEVGIFCTFYGLDMVHKDRIKGFKVSAIGNPAMPPPIPAVPVKVPDIVGMLPGMNSVATAFMKSWMKRANIPTVEDLIGMCKEMGVRLIACATTMGVMGVRQEDLIPEAECAGAAAFLDFASGADVSLFI